MSTMRNLRHLDIRECHSLSHIPIGIGRLIHLQTLSMFIMGKKGGCGISELQGLNNLRGPLHIKGLENMKNSMDAEEANLIRKRNLDSLTLSWSRYIDDQTPIIQENASSEEVLEGLQPPATIKRLEIENYQGMKFPGWMEDLSLQNLVRVVLKDCQRCKHLPPLGHLPLLKFLELSRIDSVRHLGTVEFYSGGVDDLGKGGFTLLEDIVLEEMLNLEELLLNVAEGREVLRCLVSMKIKNCDKLTTLPLLPSLQRLELKTQNENIPDGLLQIQNLSALQDQLNFLSATTSSHCQVCLLGLGN
ncbi:putative disease resistance protein RGA3 [Telopea speciosissima]|uniref:putative disease resistance protein RGA3 n=1 Tax=Telopea speciosissima TaxID=54955 RepID=UPI001CC3C24F|nr:putative disease resistance protein RGA3 [Telopea speciosissima]